MKFSIETSRLFRDLQMSIFLAEIGMCKVSWGNGSPRGMVAPERGQINPRSCGTSEMANIVWYTKDKPLLYENKSFWSPSTFALKLHSKEATDLEVVNFASVLQAFETWYLFLFKLPDCS